MILPADSEAMEAFILHETGDDEEGRTRGFPIIWERRDKGGATDFNTAILSTYAEYKGEFSYMARELMGCTVLAVISRTGFYFAHYWENVSFDPDDDILKKRKRTKEKQFQMTVLEPLNDGWPKSTKNQQMGLGKHGQEIEDGDIKAYLIRPRDSFDGTEDGYRDQWDQIKARVGEFLPKLQDDSKWEEITYGRVDKENLGDLPKGRCLFKYDPNHNPSAEGKGKKRAMLWVEDNYDAVHEDEWD